MVLPELDDDISDEDFAIINPRSREGVHPRASSLSIRQQQRVVPFLSVQQNQATQSEDKDSTIGSTKSRERLH